MAETHDFDALVERFRRERRTLAALVHPNIARVVDGGTSESGLPYFVMEWIDGEPIDEYCERHRLSVAERMELLRLVCSALSFAHGKLVVHRDVKPGNVLVFTSPDGEAQPKLVDFGIAKILGGEEPGAEHGQDSARQDGARQDGARQDGARQDGAPRAEASAEVYEERADGYTPSPVNNRRPRPR